MDATKPIDQEMTSALPAYIREVRAAINVIVAEESDITMTSLLVSAGDNALVIGTDLTAIGIEIVLLSGLGASVIEQIRGGTQGQVKIFIFQGNNVGFKDGLKSDGQLYLNQLPVATILSAQQDDVVVLVNIGGNGTSIYGYWKEIWRQVSVK